MSDACEAPEFDLRKLRFQARQASWVATVGNTFLKIPRRSGAPLDPFSGADISAACKEYRLANWLALVEPQVLRPDAIQIPDGCLMYPRLHGQDLSEELLKAQDASSARAAVREAVQICGRIHARAAPDHDVPSYDYRADPHYPLRGAQLQTEWSATPVIRGMEVRNFRRDHIGGKLYFFDLHDVFWGMPEEDVTRFLISLLMLRWGSSPVPWPWTRFDLGAVCAAYEEASAIRLDKHRVQYCMQLNFRMRYENAMRAAAATIDALKPVRLLYVGMYFAGIKQWMRKHGF